LHDADNHHLTNPFIHHVSDSDLVTDVNPNASLLSPEQRDQAFMGLAIAQAHAAAAAGEVPVGAVVVRDHQVIAAAFNRPISDHDPCAHAEILALRQAAQTVNNYRLTDCSLYVTLEPCLMCTGAMFHARLKEVIYGATDPKTGVAGSVMNLFESEQLNHHAVVRGGVRAEECGELLQTFFAARRSKKSS
jgi:tRNA(adenine34) deaminase